eukprot:jgi/Mesen1/7910/ME000420S07042
MGAEGQWETGFRHMHHSQASDISSDSENFSQSEDGATWAAQEVALFGSEYLNANKGSSVESPPSKWKHIDFGAKGTLRYRMLILDKTHREVSAWHQIPLHAGQNQLHCVCKTPKGQWIRYDVAQNEHFNPIRIIELETGLWKGRPAHFAENVPWNFGYLPQTFADASSPYDEYGGLPFDDRPVDVIEIGRRARKTGEVYAVKMLSAFAVVEDFCRLSWKVVAIAADDPTAPFINDGDDLQKMMPGCLDSIREWLRTCTCIEIGEKGYAFGMHERALSQQETVRIVSQTHASWQIYVDSHPPVSKWSLPRANAMTEDTYELIWEKYCQNASDSTLPLSNPHARSHVEYERAWKDTNDDDGGGGGKSWADLDSPASHAGSARERKGVFARLTSKVHRSTGSLDVTLDHAGAADAGLRGGEHAGAAAVAGGGGGGGEEHRPKMFDKLRHLKNGFHSRTSSTDSVLSLSDLGSPCGSEQSMPATPASDHSSDFSPSPRGSKDREGSPRLSSKLRLPRKVDSLSHLAKTEDTLGRRVAARKANAASSEDWDDDQVTMTCRLPPIIPRGLFSRSHTPSPELSPANSAGSGGGRHGKSKHSHGFASVPDWGS